MAEVIEFKASKGHLGYYLVDIAEHPEGKYAGRYVREDDYLALQLKDQNNEAAIATYTATIEKLQAQRDELLEALERIATSYDVDAMADARAAIRRVEEGR